MQCLFFLLECLFFLLECLFRCLALPPRRSATFFPSSPLSPFLFLSPLQTPKPKTKTTERDPLHQGLIVERAKLKARQQEVDLTAKLGRTQAVSAAAHKSSQGGWYCSVCDCVLKDSKAWLDHINGRYHNAALGMSMRVEKSSKDEVKEKLEALAREKEAVRAKKREKKMVLKAGGGEGDDDDEWRANSNGAAGPSRSSPASIEIDPEDAFARRIAEREAAEAAEREAKRTALAATKKKNLGNAEEEEDEEAAAMAAAMGFKSFG